MKIAKSQLRQIIREELSDVMHEIIGGTRRAVKAGARARSGDAMMDMVDGIRKTAKAGEEFDESQLDFIDLMLSSDANIDPAIMRIYNKQRRAGYVPPTPERGVYQGLSGEKFKTNPRDWTTHNLQGRNKYKPKPGSQLQDDMRQVELDAIYRDEMRKMSMFEKAKRLAREGPGWKQKYKLKIEEEWESVLLARDKALRRVHTRSRKSDIKQAERDRAREFREEEAATRRQKREEEAAFRKTPAGKVTTLEDNIRKTMADLASLRKLVRGLSARFPEKLIARGQMDVSRPAYRLGGPQGSYIERINQHEVKEWWDATADRFNSGLTPISPWNRPEESFPERAKAINDLITSQIIPLEKQLEVLEKQYTRSLKNFPK